MIGEKIREIRKKKKLTQKDLANKAGINKNSIARYERGEVSPTETIIKKLAQALEVYPSELLDDISMQDQEFTFNEKQELSMVFWGSVVDNAKKIVALNRIDEINLILPLIQSAYQILTQAKKKNGNTSKIDGSVNIKQENIGRDATVNVNS